jgi:hypothetical protein
MERGKDTMKLAFRMKTIRLNFPGGTTVIVTHSNLGREHPRPTKATFRLFDRETAKHFRKEVSVGTAARMIRGMSNPFYRPKVNVLKIKSEWVD